MTPPHAARGEEKSGSSRIAPLAAHSSSHGNFRLCHRRRGIGRQRAGVAAERGRERHGLRPRGGAVGLAPLHPYPGRLHVHPGQSQGELALQVRAQRMDRRARHRRPARQDPGRVELDQRPYLQSRPTARFRRLGPARQPRLGLCRRAALLPPERAAGRRGRRHLPRPRRQPADHRPRLARPDLRGLHRGRGPARHPAQPRLQRHHAGGRELRAAHHPERHAQERRPRLPASGDEA